AVQKGSLQKLALAEGLVANRKGIGALRAGIDASVWLSECPDNTARGESPGLTKIFDQLCALLRLAVTPVFVFPGLDSPDSRRGNKVCKIPHPLTTQFQAFIKAFGFHCHHAPGEADAELAYLNRLELVDIIFTVKEEVFIFGATYVIYSPLEDDCQEAYVYTSAGIEQNVHLSRGGLLLMAILIGGDYDQQGLVGCSEHVAYTLARRGLGDPLLLAVQTRGSRELDAFLNVWRCALRQELTQALGSLSIATPVPDTFPDPVVLELYARPVTSWSFGRPGVDASSWSPLLPDVISIVRLCENCFAWGTPAELPNKLFKILLPGLCSKRLAQVVHPQHTLLQDHVLHDRVDETVPTLSSFIDIRTFSGG
ncbi:PIN domain-like protein, partial [Mycena galericulata]